ncbi:MAG: tetratricopeptide repeat protein, partial [Candidatus Hodarchaeota archaeon]
IANKNYNNALKIAQQIKNQELQADVLFDLGSVAGIQKKYNKSLNIYRQTLKIYKKIDKPIEQGETYFEIGQILREMDEEHYQEALKNFKNALKIVIKERQFKIEIDCRIQIGDLLILTDQPQEALNHYQKAMKKSKTSKYLLGEINAYFGKGKAFFELKQYQKAIKVFESLIALYQKSKYLKGEISCLTYLSNSYDQLGEAELAKKFKKLAQDKSKKLEKK